MDPPHSFWTASTDFSRPAARQGTTRDFRRKAIPRNAAAAAKSLQSCPTLCDPIDGSPPGSPVPGILQARTLGWVAISFSNAWKRKVKEKSLSRVWLLTTPWTAAHQAPPPWDFPGKSIRVGAIAFSAGGPSGKEPTCRCRRHKRYEFGPWVEKIPWRRTWQPTAVFLPGKSHGQRSLVGYSPWGCKRVWHDSARRRQWQPTPALLPGKSHGWRSLVGCSPWGR